nr:MAG TPA: hypothetical protein [Bacteriophage sp.]
MIPVYKGLKLCSCFDLVWEIVHIFLPKLIFSHNHIFPFWSASSAPGDRPAVDSHFWEFRLLHCQFFNCFLLFFVFFLAYAGIIKNNTDTINKKSSRHFIGIDFRKTTNIFDNIHSDIANIFPDFFKIFFVKIKYSFFFLLCCFASHDIFLSFLLFALSHRCRWDSSYRPPGGGFDLFANSAENGNCKFCGGSLPVAPISAALVF